MNMKELNITATEKDPNDDERIETLDEKVERMKAEGLISTNKQDEWINFYLAICWVLMILLIIVITLKNRGII